ncbi:uncharacterized protein RJT20DRAFT_10449 [Scheffersomyces xylosifermentans]|uniref:uncharacterized protein n=1 Tax=Scheffersomyces xylosifermentans TaxID=1304137 RepID=UPI00315D9E7B
MISRLYTIITVLSGLCLALDLGFEPNYYGDGDRVELLVNKIESDKTQLPYEYYKLPFVCPPGDTAKPVHLSLGEILRGDRIWQSNYELYFGVDMPCMRLCDLIARENNLKRADSLIKNGYVVHWSLDGLPGATTFVSNNNYKYYAAGFPLGFVKDDISYIYNHVMIVIRYHTEGPNKHSIVGFEVYPKSVSNEQCPGSSKNFQNFAIPVEYKSDGKLAPQKSIIPYTYSVYWREDNSIEYDSRWDLYYENETNDSNHHIHWISFVNSLVLLFLGSLIVAIVLLRLLRKDISSSSVLPSHEVERSWKGLISEVSQKPKFTALLTTLVASGIQTLIAVVGVIFIFVINSKFSFSRSRSASTFFNAHQGAFFSFSLFCFIASGCISSYIGIIVHKIFNNDYLNQEYSIGKTVRLSFLFSGFLPCLAFLVILFLNFFVWAKESSTALPFGTIIVILLLFFIIECPLGFIGGYYGNRRKFDRKSTLFNSSLLSPTKDSFADFAPKSLIAEKGPWLLNPFISIIVFGLIPFGIVYVELLFIFNSVWLEKTTFYYMYSFLFLTTVILIVIIVESTIIAVYISLAVYHNSHWHWLSFRIGSSISWFIFGYSIYYFVFYLSVHDFVSSLLYFGYMALACTLIGVSCGAVGLLTGLVFINKIYRAVKVD